MTHSVYCFICQHYVITWLSFVTLEHNVQIGTSAQPEVVFLRGHVQWHVKWCVTLQWRDKVTGVFPVCTTYQHYCCCHMVKA